MDRAWFEWSGNKRWSGGWFLIDGHDRTYTVRKVDGSALRRLKSRDRTAAEYVYREAAEIAKTAFWSPLRIGLYALGRLIGLPLRDLWYELRRRAS
jgi:hypothetical protein